MVEGSVIGEQLAPDEVHCGRNALRAEHAAKLARKTRSLPLSGVKHRFHRNLGV
jgi:hypothetical protein